MQEEELQELYGKIASVIYTNEENGYAVLRLEEQGGETDVYKRQSRTCPKTSWT